MHIRRFILSVDYSKMTVVQLREKAKEIGLRSVTSFKKAELVQLLTDIQAKEEAKARQSKKSELSKKKKLQRLMK